MLSTVKARLCKSVFRYACRLAAYNHNKSRENPRKEQVASFWFGTMRYHCFRITHVCQIRDQAYTSDIPSYCPIVYGSSGGCCCGYFDGEKLPKNQSRFVIQLLPISLLAIVQQVTTVRMLPNGD